MQLSDIRTAPLDDPLYYLYNARQVIQFCLARYRDLLTGSEVSDLEQLLELPDTAQALLIRLIMRKGDYFRLDRLNYPEIPDQTQAITALESAGLLRSQPLIDIRSLCGLCLRAECLQLTKVLLPDISLKATSRKSDLTAQLNDAFQHQPPVRLHDWWPEAPFSFLALDCRPLFDRLRLLFFGNLHQSWSEFVLTELGVQRYETVTISGDQRPFHHREEVDHYLALQSVQDRLTDGEAVSVLVAELSKLVAELPEKAPAADWLDYRLNKLLFRLARQAERDKETDLACTLYQRSNYREAGLRYLRLQEKVQPPEALYRQACNLLQHTVQPEIRLSLQRLIKRCARKAGYDYQPPASVHLQTQYLTLPVKPGQNVESAVTGALRESGAQAYHVENRLFTGLFALLFWPALFAPVRGAFFNPFQSAPADLYRPGFASLRADWLAQGFALLEKGDYKTTILTRLQDKRGLRCRLIHWPTLSDSLVAQALDVIPRQHLASVFRHLLQDIRGHSRGLPDLIVINPATNTYQLIEVKGPGDRLQDHQRLWLETLQAEGLPVSVCYVQWQETAVPKDNGKT